MTKKLVHVVRGTPDLGLEVFLDGANVRRNPMVIMTSDLDPDRANMATHGEFFLVEENDAEEIMRHLANSNPGREVRIYGLEVSGQCPAAAMVVKKVTTHGVLPG